MFAQVYVQSTAKFAYLPKEELMSKETSDPSTFTPYIRYGFTEQFSGAAGSIEWTKWNEELKTAVLRCTPRQRKLVLGEYRTEDEEDEEELDRSLLPMIPAV